MKRKLLIIMFLFCFWPVVCSGQDFRSDLASCRASQHAGVTIYGPKNRYCRVMQPNAASEVDFRTGRKVEARDCNYPLSILPDFCNNLAIMDKTISSDMVKYKKSLAKILDYQLKYCKQ